MKNGYEEDMNLQKYNRMKKPANRLYMALALGGGDMPDGFMRLGRRIRRR